jgi:hypothetical protein
VLLAKKVVSQEEIDHAVGDIFAKIALDKTLGTRTELLNAFDVLKIERAVRAMLHPGRIDNINALRRRARHSWPPSQ